MINIKRAQPQDTAVLADIQIKSWQGAFAKILSAQTLEKFTQYDRVKGILDDALEQNFGTLYIGYLDYTPCGEFFWRDYNGIAEIVAVHSIPESWGSGLGKAMMIKALEDIAECGYKSACLWVFEKNLRAKRFYEKCGFVKSGEINVSDFDSEKEEQYIIAL